MTEIDDMAVLEPLNDMLLVLPTAVERIETEDCTVRTIRARVLAVSPTLLGQSEEGEEFNIAGVEKGDDIIFGIVNNQPEAMIGRKTLITVTSLMARIVG